jgi:phospholipase C
MSCKSALKAPFGATGHWQEARLSVDGPDVAPAPLPRELALLRGERQPARLRGQPDVLPPRTTGASTPGIWNPLPRFDTVQQDHQLGNIQPLGDFYPAARKARSPRSRGSLRPRSVSEHPPALVTAGQTWVTAPDQRDHAEPRLEVDSDLPRLGRLGRLLRPHQAAARRRRGLRDPGARARDQPVCDAQGFVDHQVLSSDAYLKFIEDDFLHGRRLNPRTDGRPDSRPDVRENVKILGNLVSDFDFDQKPRTALLLPLHPPFS